MCLEIANRFPFPAPAQENSGKRTQARTRRVDVQQSRSAGGGQFIARGVADGHHITVGCVAGGRADAVVRVGGGPGPLQSRAGGSDRQYHPTGRAHHLRRRRRQRVAPLRADDHLSRR